MSVTSEATSDYINKASIHQGVITINATSDGTMAVRVVKDNLHNDYVVSGTTRLPLQHGNGNYTVYVLKNVSGSKYKIVQSQKISLNMESLKDVYLQSIQMIQWNQENLAIEKAKELTQNATSAQEKVALIYDYIYSNINYDNQKESQLTSTYVPDIDNTILAGSGICYDYASLFAAMLRSVDVPTKLVMGHKDDIQVYHAWNQIYLEESNQWITVDITYDVTTKTKDIFKEESSYTVENAY